MGAAPAAPIFTIQKLPYGVSIGQFAFYSDQYQYQPHDLPAKSDSAADDTNDRLIASGAFYHGPNAAAQSDGAGSDGIEPNQGSQTNNKSKGSYRSNGGGRGVLIIRIASHKKRLFSVGFAPIIIVPGQIVNAAQNFRFRIAKALKK